MPKKDLIRLVIIYWYCCY